MTAAQDTMRAAAEHRVFGQVFTAGRLPEQLEREAAARFGELWELHPAQFYEMKQPFTGTSVPVPRWQQAYGRDYRYSGNVNRALPIPELLQPFLAWARAAIDARLNGLLVNWYDAALAHRIGAHRDSIAGLVEGAPIVTVSIGAGRAFRLWPAKGKGFVDFEAVHGSVFVLPWETNRTVKHGVPHRAGDSGRRISVTARAFQD
jgi:alkylated DNA repair dioxygenase AlkB